jgi:HTH-type transcriptional regulator / antitoxin HigA
MKSKLEVKPIRNERDLYEALEQMNKLFDATPGTAEGDTLEILMALVENYEARNHPIPPPTAIEAIKFRMEQSDMQPKDLVPYLGTKSRVSEVLSGKRSLTLAMIRRLSDGLGIPVASLVR